MKLKELLDLILDVQIIHLIHNETVIQGECEALSGMLSEEIKSMPVDSIVAEKDKLKIWI